MDESALFHGDLGRMSIIPKNPTGRNIPNRKQTTTIGAYLGNSLRVI